MIIFIFGDSIVQGYWDSQGGWADRVKAEVLKLDIENSFKYYHGVHNLGIDGNTTKQVLNRFDAEVESRLWRDSQYGFIFAMGVNDTVTETGKGDISNPEAYAQQLGELYEKATTLTDKIAFLNLLPVNEGLTNPLPASSTGKRFTNSRIEEFNAKLERTCAEKSVQIIDVRSNFLDTSYNELLVDGLHPNDKGHEFIFQSVMPIVKSWLYTQA